MEEVKQDVPSEMLLDIKTNFGTNIIQFNNYETVLEQAKAYAEKYNYIIPDDPKAIEQATKDKAKINNSIKLINARRIEIKKDFEEKTIKPFENQMKSVAEELQVASDNLKVQLDAVKEREDQKKYNEILLYYNTEMVDFLKVLPFENVFIDKWTNKGTKIDDVKAYINELKIKVKNDFDILEREEKATYLKDFYLNHKLDLSATLQEKARMEEKERQLKELEEKKRKEKELEEEKQRQLEEERQKQLELLANEFANKSVEEKYKDSIKKDEVKEEVQVKEEEKAEPKEEEKKVKYLKGAFMFFDTEDKIHKLQEFLKLNNINYKGLKRLENGNYEGTIEPPTAK